MIDKIVHYIQINPKRALIQVMLFWAVIGTCGTAWHYYSTGTVSVSTNDDTSVIQLTKTANPKVTSQSAGHLNARLSPGDYSVLVSTKNASSRRIISVKVRSHSSYMVNLSKPLEAEVALSYGAHSIVGDSVHVRFVDMRDSQLYEASANGVPTPLAPSISFKSIKWLSPDFGVGLATEGHNLYAIKSGVVNQITLPFSDTDHLSYDIASNQALLVSNGSAIYETASAGSFAKVYSADSSSVIQSIGGGANRIFVGLTPRGGQSSEDKASYIMLDLNGSTVAKLEHTSIYSYRWSPSGKQIVVADPSGTVIYNDSLQEYSRLADKNALGLTWLDDQTLLYGLDDGLYRYDLGGSASSQLVSVGGGRSVSGVYVSQDRQMIYVTAGESGASRTQGFSVLKVALKTNSHPLTARLSALFPLRVDQCSAQFINFVQPNIVLNLYNPSAGDSCRQVVINYIAKIGAAGSGYNIYVGSVDVGAD